MKLYIRLVDGTPIDHPILEENLLQAFPDIDIENLPPTFAQFERIAQPNLGPYEKYQRLRYELGSDGVCRDVWECDSMSAEEIAAKKQEAQTWWSQYGFASWTFNEETCQFDPPILEPDEEHPWEWDEPNQTWILVE